MYIGNHFVTAIRTMAKNPRITSLKFSRMGMVSYFVLFASGCFGCFINFLWLVRRTSTINFFLVQHPFLSLGTRYMGGYFTVAFNALDHCAVLLTDGALDACI